MIQCISFSYFDHHQAYENVLGSLSDPLPENAYTVELPAQQMRRCGRFISDPFAAYRWVFGGMDIEGAAAADPGPIPLPRPLSNYQYTILIDSSVRGPFIPPMIKVSERCSLVSTKI